MSYSSKSSLLKYHTLWDVEVGLLFDPLHKPVPKVLQLYTCYLYIGTHFLTAKLAKQWLPLYRLTKSSMIPFLIMTISPFHLASVHLWMIAFWHSWTWFLTNMWNLVNFFLCMTSMTALWMNGWRLLSQSSRSSQGACPFVLVWVWMGFEMGCHATAV